MKFRFSFLWILYICLAFISHAIKIYLTIFLMLFLHEMAHVIVAKYFKYKVDTITVTPFGFMATIYHLDYGNVAQRLLILWAGLSMHFVYPLVFLFFKKMGIISIGYMNYLNQINMAIFTFNLLPIYPLDGARILMCFFYKCKYENSRKIIQIISIITILIVFNYSPINMKLLLCFLFILLIQEIKRNEVDHVEFCYEQRKYLKLNQNNV